MTLACLLYYLQLCMMCLAERRCTVSSLCMLEAVCGSQTMLAYSKIGRTIVLCTLGIRGGWSIGDDDVKYIVLSGWSCDCFFRVGCEKHVYQVLQF